MEFSIRPVAPGDAAPIAEIYRPYVEGTAVSFEEAPPTPEEMAERIEKTLATHPWFVAIVDGSVVGYAYAGFHRPRPAYRWSAEVTVYLNKDFQGRGIGRALYEALFLELSERGFVRAFAGIALPNPGSVALHESMGFAPIGIFPGIGYKLGRWHDVAWYWRALRDTEEPPTDPFLDSNRSS